VRGPRHEGETGFWGKEGKKKERLRRKKEKKHPPWPREKRESSLESPAHNVGGTAKREFIQSQGGLEKAVIPMEEGKGDIAG